MWQYYVRAGGEGVWLDTAQGAIAVHARNPWLARVLMRTDEADNVRVGDIKDGAGWMIR